MNGAQLRLYDFLNMGRTMIYSFFDPFKADLS